MAIHRLHRGIDVSDVATAHERAVESPAPGGARVFVISGRTPLLPRDCEEVSRDAPAVLRRRAPELVAMLMRRGWPMPGSIDRIFDSRLAARELGWQPEHGPERVLQMFDESSAEALPH